jgi:hypothetical protein
MAENEEIVLSELSDEDPVKQMHDDLYDGPPRRSSRARTSCSRVGGRRTGS